MYDFLSFDAKIIDQESKVLELLIWKGRSGYFLNLQLKEQCKFNNCLHKDEPKCEEAMEDEIAWSRYNSYLKLLEGDDENYRTDIHNEDQQSVTK
jgi:ribosome biogenesis GTPase